MDELKWLSDAFKDFIRRDLMGRIKTQNVVNKITYISNPSFQLIYSPPPLYIIKLNRISNSIARVHT